MKALMTLFNASTSWFMRKPRRARFDRETQEAVKALEIARAIRERYEANSAVVPESEMLYAERLEARNEWLANSLQIYQEGKLGDESVEKVVNTVRFIESCDSALVAWVPVYSRMEQKIEANVRREFPATRHGLYSKLDAFENSVVELEDTNGSELERIIVVLEKSHFDELLRRDLVDALNVVTRALNEITPIVETSSHQPTVEKMLTTMARLSLITQRLMSVLETTA